MNLAKRTGAIVALLAFGPLGNAQVTLTPLPSLPAGSGWTYCNAVSGNGAVAVGYGSELTTQALRWQGAVPTVLTSLNPSGYYHAHARGVSSDGSVVVGGASDTDGRQIPVRWSGGSVAAIRDAETLGGLAMDCSADGSVVVGFLDSRGERRAFRWTQAGGIADLGTFPGGPPIALAYAVSDDGSVVGGFAVTGDPTFYYRGFRWTAAGGIEDLGQLPGTLWSTIPRGISGDGGTLVGYASTDQGVVPFRWTEATGMVPLSMPPNGTPHGLAHGCSHDGSVIVGRAFGNRNEAFIWDPSNGPRFLIDVLSEGGVDTSGWILVEATGVSADGSVVVGYGRDPSGNYRAWRATLAVPPPAVAVSVPSTLEVGESEGSLGLVVSLPSPAAGAVTVDLVSHPISASVASDYLPVTTTVTIPAGQTEVTVNVGIVDDTRFEGDEAFSLEISNPTGAQLGSAVCLVTIRDDDPRPRTPADVVFPGSLDRDFAENGATFQGKSYPGNDSPRDTVVDPEGRTLIAGIYYGGNYDRPFVLRLGSDGQPDPTFGDGGFVVPWGFQGTSWAMAIALEQSGRILVCGKAFPTGSSLAKLVVARLLPDGSPDTGFGTGGTFTYVGAAGSSSEGRDILAMDDGSVRVLAAHTVSNVTVPLMIALDGTGAPLGSFSGDGVHFLFSNDAQSVSPNTMAQDQDGRFLIGGTLSNDFGVARVLPDGNTDTGFGTGGFVRMTFSAETDYVSALAVDGGGRISGAGPWDAVEGQTQRLQFGLFRLLPDGSPDTSFHFDGRAHPSLGTGGSEQPQSLALLQGGRMLVAGQTVSGCGVIRVLPDGTLDATFGTGGITLIGPTSASARSMHVTPTGDTLLVGNARIVGNQYDLVIARLTPWGLPDSGWGTDGVLVHDLGRAVYESEWLGISRDSQGRFLVAGYARYGGSYNQAVLARFGADGTFDPGFGDGGFAVYARNLVDISAQDVKVDFAGRILMIGTDDRANLFVRRYNSNGMLDTSYGVGGTRTFRPVSGWFSFGAKGVLLPDGGVVVASTCSTGGIQQVCMTRLDPNGTVDPTFGTSGHYLGSHAANHRCRVLLRAADGALLMAGDTDISGAGKPFFAKFSPDGVPDPAFGNGGFVEHGQYPGNHLVGAACLTADGSVVVAGVIGSYPGTFRSQCFVLRLGVDGAPDAGFGNAGISVPNLELEGGALGVDTGVGGLVQLADGRLLVGAFARFDNGDGDVLMLRFGADGALDTGFGIDGKAGIDLEPGKYNGGYDRIGAMLEAGNDRVVCAGVGYLSSIQELKPALFAVSVADIGFADRMVLAGLSGADADASADPNHDGVNNLLAVAFGIDPVTGAGREERYPAAALSGDGSRGSLRFTIPVSPPADLTYVVYESCDLTGWTEVARRTGAGPWTGISAITTLSDSGGYREVELQGSSPDCGFYRVEVSLGASD